MRKLYISAIAIIILSTPSLIAQENTLDVIQLLGRWKLDMSPQDKSDNNFAMMEITAERIIPLSTMKMVCYMDQLMQLTGDSWLYG